MTSFFRLITTASLALSSFCLVNGTETHRPNVVFILADDLGLKLPTSVKLDGVSQRPALENNGSPRLEIFCHFPHDTPASDQRPGTSVRRGDWKLIHLYA